MSTDTQHPLPWGSIVRLTRDHTHSGTTWRVGTIVRVTAYVGGEDASNGVAHYFGVSIEDGSPLEPPAADVRVASGREIADRLYLTPQAVALRLTDVLDGDLDGFSLSGQKSRAFGDRIELHGQAMDGRDLTIVLAVTSVEVKERTERP